MPSTLQGFGLGLRTEHYAELAELAELAEPGTAKPDWLEILSENYLVPGGRPLHHLDRQRAEFPVVMHGVSLSIGSTDPLNLTYLRELKALAELLAELALAAQAHADAAQPVVAALPQWLSDDLLSSTTSRGCDVAHAGAAATRIARRI